MRCWMCGGEHEWSRRWAYYVDNPRDLPVRQPIYAD
jgi:hypothetical protein